MSILESIKITPVPTTNQESAFPQWRDRLKKIRRRLLEVLAVYLDDLLLVAGCACFTSGAAIKWGTAEALGVCGVCLTAYAIIVARGGIGRR